MEYLILPTTSPPVLLSPANVSRFLNIQGPSEDDVLHSTGLPTFGNTLSREESEMLMSYLTVDYVRIPMVLGFFASRDRVTYLFNPSLQALLRAVLFEGGAWVSQYSDRPILEVGLVHCRRLFFFLPSSRYLCG